MQGAAGPTSLINLHNGAHACMLPGIGFPGMGTDIDSWEYFIVIHTLLTYDALHAFMIDS